MNKIKKIFTFPIILILISCSGSDDDSLLVLEASIVSSNDNPSYDETYTVTWESNASQCYATSTTGAWLGELPPSGSREFVAKREGNSNYGVQCRKSINFVNAFVDVLVSKDFKDYFDYDEAPIYDLGSLILDSDSSLSVLDASIGDYNGDFDLDLILLLEESTNETSENSTHYILAFYNTDLSSLSDQNQYVFEEINQGNCAASSLTRLDANEDGFQDIMTVSESADKSLNKRGICFFTGSEDGLVLKDESFLVNDTNLDLSNVEVGTNISYDVNGNLRPDFLLIGNGGTTDLPFYVVPSEDGPSILLPSPFNSLNPYTRSQGCIENLTFLCEWDLKDYHFEESVIINADGDGILDIIFSIKTSEGPLYNLYNQRIEDVFFDWSIPTLNYINSSLSSDDGIALRMSVLDGNLDGYTDLIVYEKSLSTDTYKISIYEKIVSDDDSTNDISSINNGDFPNEYAFETSSKFSDEILIFDLDFNGRIDIFMPYTELPYKEGNVSSDKHFLAYEKYYVVNEDTTNTQEWILQDFSDSIGLDSSSVNNSWIDFDGDNDIDVILLIPEVSSDGAQVNYNFRLFLNSSLF